MQRPSGAVLFRLSLISVLIVSLWARTAGSNDRRGFSRKALAASPVALRKPPGRRGYGVERTTYEVTIGFAVGRPATSAPTARPGG
jgi:hypothetical protein